MFRNLFFKRREDMPKRFSDESSGIAEAIQRNRDAIEALEKRHFHIQKKMQLQETAAREHMANGDKRGAAICLKRKHMYASDLDQLAVARITLESQIVSLEATHTQHLAVTAMAGAAKVHKALSDRINVGKIDQLVDDIQEQQDLQNEVTQALAQGNPHIDEVDISRELDEMEAQEIEARLFQATPAIPFTSSRISAPIYTSSNSIRVSEKPYNSYDTPQCREPSISSSISALGSKDPLHSIHKIKNSTPAQPLLVQNFMNPSMRQKKEISANSESYIRSEENQLQVLLGQT